MLKKTFDKKHRDEDIFPFRRLLRVLLRAIQRGYEEKALVCYGELEKGAPHKPYVVRY